MTTSWFFVILAVMAASIVVLSIFINLVMVFTRSAAPARRESGSPASRAALTQ